MGFREIEDWFYRMYRMNHSTEVKNLNYNKKHEQVSVKNCAKQYTSNVYTYFLVN